MDRSNPARPTLEVDAVTRAGDLDQGPLLLTVADYVAMVGDEAVARRCVEQLQRRGRVVDFMGVAHVSFPTWTTVR